MTTPPRNQNPAAAIVDHDALPMGTRFGEFEILRVLGMGGFGIVYLAHDHSLQRAVALKEYMPASLASRGKGPAITVRSSAFAETYAVGLRSFINEARLLARFDHPSLVKVFRFWEDNATAYMVMPYLQGTTLRDARVAMTRPPDEAWIRALLAPMLDALELLHREGVYHRDVAPDNILLLDHGQPMLLDFGAARHVISDRTQSLTAILKPSYAPIEQYAEMTQMRQGPWTDIYALGAVLHYLLFGLPPAPATARAIEDMPGRLAHGKLAGVSPQFLAIVTWMLAVRPLDRPQSVHALREVLEGRAAIPPRAHNVTAPPPPGGNRHVEGGRPPDDSHRGTGTRLDTSQRPMPVVSPPTASRSRTHLAIAGIVGVLVLLAAFWFVIVDRPPPPLAVTAAASAAAAAASAQATLAAAASSASSVLASVNPPPIVPAVLAASEVQAPFAASAASGAASRPRRQTAASRPSDTVAPPVVIETRPEPPPVAPPPETAAAEPPPPSTAHEACGKRVFLALASCLERECEKPAYRDKPDCEQVLEMKHKRERRSAGYN